MGLPNIYSLTAPIDVPALRRAMTAGTTVSLNLSALDEPGQQQIPRDQAAPIAIIETTASTLIVIVVDGRKYLLRKADGFPDICVGGATASAIFSGIFGGAFGVPELDPRRRTGDTP